MTLNLTKRIAGGITGLFVGTLLALAAPLTYAQTTTPGIPATGAGGDSLLNLLILGVAAVVLAVGGIYLAATRHQV